MDQSEFAWLRCGIVGRLLTICQIFPQERLASRSWKLTDPERICMTISSASPYCIATCNIHPYSVDVSGCEACGPSYSRSASGAIEHAPTPVT